MGCSVKLVSCHLDLDPSLLDRVHRTADALNAVAKLTPTIVQSITDAAHILELNKKTGRLVLDQFRVRMWLENMSDMVR